VAEEGSHARTRELDLVSEAYRLAVIPLYFLQNWRRSALVVLTVVLRWRLDRLSPLAMCGWQVAFQGCCILARQYLGVDGDQK
jgi:hypothetical protein